MYVQLYMYIYIYKIKSEMIFPLFGEWPNAYETASVGVCVSVCRNDRQIYEFKWRRLLHIFFAVRCQFNYKSQMKKKRKKNEGANEPFTKQWRNTINKQNDKRNFHCWRNPTEYLIFYAKLSAKCWEHILSVRQNRNNKIFGSSQIASKP